jgi:hypothetical protein
MEAIRSSETSGTTLRTTRRHIPEDDTLQNHRCENLKSYIGWHGFGKYKDRGKKRAVKGKEELNKKKREEERKSKDLIRQLMDWKRNWNYRIACGHKKRKSKEDQFIKGTLFQAKLNVPWDETSATSRVGLAFKELSELNSSLCVSGIGGAPDQPPPPPVLTGIVRCRVGSASQ